jgi:hypothetical protein
VSQTVHETGRLKAVVALTIMVLVSATVISLYVARLGTDKLPVQAIRFGLTCALARLVYRGSKWAYRATIVLLGIAAVGSLATLSAEMLILASAYGSVISLLLQSDTRQFLASQELRNQVAKRYGLAAHEIRDVARGRGSCIASDMILVQGLRVGYMYRETPDDDHDSGWRFFSGRESQEYADNAANFSRFDVNTVANYDPDIVPLLASPYGTVFERDSSGQLVVAAPLDLDAN